MLLLLSKKKLQYNMKVSYSYSCWPNRTTSVQDQHIRSHQMHMAEQARATATQITLVRH
jgi:hypothetical protein